MTLEPLSRFLYESSSAWDAIYTKGEFPLDNCYTFGTLNFAFSPSDLYQIDQIFFLRDRGINSEFFTDPEYFISVRDKCYSNI